MPLGIEADVGKIILALLTLVLSGCGGQPSEIQGKQILETRLSRELRGAPFEITSFLKINGQEGQYSGVPFYRMMYQAQVVLPEGNHPECVKRGSEFVGFDCTLKFGNPTGIGPQERGASLMSKGTIEFQKTENGWIPASAVDQAGLDAARAAAEDANSRAAQREMQNR